MADRRGRVRSPVLKLRTTSARLIRPDELGAKIENMYPTEEGTLRSIWGPAPYQPLYSALHNGAPESGATALANVSPQSYGPMRGICHALIREGQRDILLIHTGTELWMHEGWDQHWTKIIGSGGMVNVELDDSNRAQFPTQFVTTPTGVVIIPQGRRAYFFDGDECLPLGYDHAPDSPTAHGPESSANQPTVGTTYGGINDVRYAHDALPGRPQGMHPIFRYGRLGLVVSPTNYAAEFDGAATEGTESQVVMSWLEPGEWRARTQWIDRWGNLSPLSEPSEAVRVERQPATRYVGVTESRYVRGEMVRKQIAWSSIAAGPEGTVGRDLYRTRDTKQTGDTKFYWVPPNARATSNPFATMPDNMSTVWPDNVPDEWLFREPIEVAPMPEFKLGALAFGRLWIANTAGAPGLVRCSMVGRWGTMPVGKEFYPDPSGGAITGLHSVNRGLLVFTETSTYLVESNDNGDSFRTMPVSRTVGCVAPSSIATTDDGTTVWLGRDGFYAWRDGEPQYLFEDHRVDVRMFTKGRMCQAVAVFNPRTREYRCWLSTEGSVSNNICYCFDGTGWRTRTDVAAMGACVTQDHRSYNIVCGFMGDRGGVWVLDHQVPTTTPDARTYTIETGWISSQDSQERVSTVRVTLWLRETIDSLTTTSRKLDIDVYRDWRAISTQTTTAHVVPADDTRASYWGGAIAATSKWAKRRPFWTTVHVDVRAAETFKLKITSDVAYEFIGLQFEQIPTDGGGAKVP